MHVGQQLENRKIEVEDLKEKLAWKEQHAQNLETELNQL